VIHKGYSTDSDSIEIINQRKWNLVFIDGNHEYEIVKEDFENTSRNLADNGIIVIDDSSLYSDYIPKSYSTKGHPGPSRLADEIKKNQFTEILQVGHNRVFQKLS
jgi:predicted O-methyltransferase YrrM